MTSHSEVTRWRATFTSPDGQGVYFYWFDAIDKDDARRIATDYAARSLLAKWTLSLWNSKAAS